MRDPTTITLPNYQSMCNYYPAIAQAIADIGAFPFHLKLPVAFGTADAAILFTVPTGMKIEIHKAYWEPTTSFTGGSSSAIGLSSSNAAYTTKGDILGGAAGDVAAGLVSTGSAYKGVIGAKMAGPTSGAAILLLVAADTIRFDRITSAFTAGAGFAHITGAMLVD